MRSWNAPLPWAACRSAWLSQCATFTSWKRACAETAWCRPCVPEPGRGGHVLGAGTLPGGEFADLPGGYLEDVDHGDRPGCWPLVAGRGCHGRGCLLLLPRARGHYGDSWQRAEVTDGRQRVACGSVRAAPAPAAGGGLPDAGLAGRGRRRRAGHLAAAEPGRRRRRAG